MKHIEVIKKYLLNNIEKLEKTLENAKEARDKAPSAMESASDETRSRMESQVEMLNNKINEEENMLSLLPGTIEKGGKIKTWDLVEIEKNGQDEFVVIVPTGLGGKKIDKFLLVSKDSPYGKRLYGRNIDENFSFNSSSIKVISIN